MNNVLVVSCAFLIGLIIFFSTIICTFPVHDYGNSNHITNEDNKSLLLISIVACIPSLMISSVDFVEQIFLVYKMNALPPQFAEKSFRLLKIVAIFVPNATIYSIIVNSPSFDTLHLIGQIQNEMLFTQSLILIACTFCAILFGRSYTSSIAFAKKLALALIISFAVFKFFLLLSLIIPNETGSLVCFMMSFVFLVSGMVILMRLCFKIAVFLSREMKGFKFEHYSQMHDFYRIIGAAIFAIYLLVIYAKTNHLASAIADGEDYRPWAHYLIGQTVMVVFINVIDHKCMTLEAALRGDQLKTRLDLIRYISHEMRSPLNTSFLGLQILRGNVNIVAESIKTCRAFLRKNKTLEGLEATRILSRAVNEIEEVKETSELVKESSCIALETLNDMLTFDKIDEKKLVLEKEEMNVWSFVSDTIRPFRINAMKEDVTMTSECVNVDTKWFENYYVHADKFKLKQVLRNFVSNAMKFCDKLGRGEVQIVVEKRQVVSRKALSLKELATDKVDAVQDVVRVNVKDNGCGISPENQKKLFRQYVQFNASALQQGQGSGLGLWICKSRKYYIQ